MRTKHLAMLAAIVPLALLLIRDARGEGAAPQSANAASSSGYSLADPAAADPAKRFTPILGSESQVSAVPGTDAAAPGVIVNIQPGDAGYPGVNLKPVGAETWDLSAYGYVEARITNTGAGKLGFNLRVDNAGDWHAQPWNCEQVWLKPGETGTVRVIFGFSYGHNPGYALKQGAVTNIAMFTGKSAVAQSFRIESLTAGGAAGEKPPVDPRSVRVKPQDGVILGPGVTIDPAKQIEATGGAQAAMAGGGLQITLPASGAEQSVSLKPAAGRWDLRDAIEVRAKLRNTGKTPVTLSAQVGSNGGPTDLIAAQSPLMPGTGQEIVVPFEPAVTFKGEPSGTAAKQYNELKGTGTHFISDAASAFKITARHEGEAALLVESITADAPAAVTPDWLGKRPPVEGDWVKTFDDEFDGTAVDGTKWNIYGENYWDKRTHWSKENLIVGDGVARLHFEKKHGYQNDDPKSILALTNPKTGESDYACGFLETYGKWVQRYGYFEARLKLPRAPGLWPAFWLMPDRGVEAGPQWKRQDTGNGGMEFDIMEHLTRWGPHRHDFGMHWDGYTKTHKSIVSLLNYVQPDKDGFITSGLLWTPGSAIYYCNGREIGRWEDPRISTVPSNIIIEMTTGGWDNSPIDDAQLPADFVIDYVRVWQRKDLASSVDGTKSPAASKTENPAK